MSLTIDPWADSDDNFNYSSGTFDSNQPVLAKSQADAMRRDIQADLAVSQQNDPPLQSDLINKTLTEVRIAATTGTGQLSVWAASLLDALWHRSRSGVPYREPQEPAWSLDPERERPFERALDEDERRGH